MSELVTALISLACSSAVTTIVGIIVKKTISKHDKEKQKHEEEIRELEEIKSKQHQDDLKNSTIAAIREEIVPKLQELDDNVKKISSGTLSSLRNDILTCYYKCNEKGYRNDYDYTNIHDLYDAYKQLNGNSFIEDIMDRFDKLPTKEEFRRQEEEKLAEVIVKQEVAKQTKKKKVIINEDIND